MTIPRVIGMRLSGCTVCSVCGAAATTTVERIIGTWRDWTGAERHTRVYEHRCEAHVNDLVAYP
jgi:hypothetical protein